MHSIFQKYQIGETLIVADEKALDQGGMMLCNGDEVSVIGIEVFEKNPRIEVRLPYGEKEYFYEQELQGFIKQGF